MKAIQFLNETGPFITKSGDKVCKYFGISKYTLYSYIDESKGINSVPGFLWKPGAFVNQPFAEGLGQDQVEQDGHEGGHHHGGRAEHGVDPGGKPRRPACRTPG